MKKIAFGVILIFGVLVSAFIFARFKPSTQTKNSSNTSTTQSSKKYQNPLMIEAMRERKYPGSDFKIEQTLDTGINYKKYIASYLSDNLKIYGLLTIPNGEAPKGGFPAIIFNHGYIPPDQYRTTERYIAYQDGFARSGYVTFKSDYRGNGSSEGKAQNSYYSPNYTVDVLNALSSIKKIKEVNPSKIGMWGHSMGGNITLRALVIDPLDIKVAVIWSGVVGTYDDLLNHWHPNRYTLEGNANVQEHLKSIRQNLVSSYGTPASNPSFWNQIDPYNFIPSITSPIQIHQGTADEDVPPVFAQHLRDALQKYGKTVEYYTYDGADHNLSQPFDLVMQRSVAFFDKYLK